MSSRPSNVLATRAKRSSLRFVTLEISTPALLFPAISLLFLSFTNRFLHLAALIRHLHNDWLQRHDDALLAQIDNIRRRLKLIRWMQLLGALSLLLCVVSMIAVLNGAGGAVVRFDDHTPLTYGKPDFANPFFIAYAPDVALKPA